MTHKFSENFITKCNEKAPMFSLTVRLMNAGFPLPSIALKPTSDEYTSGPAPFVI